MLDLRLNVNNQTFQYTIKYFGKLWNFYKFMISCWLYENLLYNNLDAITQKLFCISWSIFKCAYVWVFLLNTIYQMLIQRDSLFLNQKILNIGWEWNEIIWKFKKFWKFESMQNYFIEILCRLYLYYLESLVIWSEKYKSDLNLWAKNFSNNNLRHKKIKNSEHNL
jgi:hypothetical protein